MGETEEPEPTDDDAAAEAEEAPEETGGAGDASGQAEQEEPAEQEDQAEQDEQADQIGPSGPEPSPLLKDVKLFDRYPTDGIAIPEPGLARYVNLQATIVPHTGGRHADRTFGKQKVNIVERLVNSMMRTEEWTGKKHSAYRAVKDAFEIVEERTQDNPVQVFVHALVNAGPREETTRLRYGGISVPKAVDTGPARRIDFALRNLATGAVAASHKAKAGIAECLAREIMHAADGNPQSYAVSKKEETERVAKSAR